jgi:hypothetical protein
MTAAARSAAAACVATERLRKGGELAWAKSMAGGEIGLESAALVAQEREGDGERRLVPRRKGRASKFCI